MPENNETSVKITTASFMDAGAETPYGTSGGTITIYPDVEGSKVKAAFNSFDLNRMDMGGMTMGDEIVIYDGINTSATAIGTFGDESPATVTATNTDGALTFKFNSVMGNDSHQGWQADLSLEGDVNPPANEGYNFQAGDNTKEVEESFMFYDDGGAEANYTKDLEGKLVLTPAEASQKVMIDFQEFEVDAIWVDFEIYNGNSTDFANKIGKFTSNPGVVKSSSDDGMLTIKYKSYAYGTTKSGWKAEVSCFTPAPLTFASATATQNNVEEVFRSQANVEVLGVEVNIDGDFTPINISSMKFSTTGTTDLINITKASLYYTAQNGSFATTNKVAEITEIAENITFDANFEINLSGKHHFWLAYDLSADAATGNKIDATFDAITVAETEYTPEVTNPAGDRTVQDAFSGTHTIGPSAEADFATVNEALQALVDGFEGHIVFNMEAGEYNSNLNIPAIPGASENTSITIKSASGNPEDVVFKKSGYGDIPVLTLNSVTYFTFEGITFKSEVTNIEALVRLKNMSRHNTFRNCIFTAPMSTSYSSSINLLTSEANNEENQNNDYNTYENNTFEGGYIGISLEGCGYVALPKETGNIVRNNTFKNQGSKAIYVPNQKNITVCGNIINNNETTKRGFQGIDAYRVEGNSFFYNNKISLDLNFESIGMEFRPMNGDDESMIYNNMISMNASAEGQYGILLDDACSNIGIYYNTINMSGTPSTSAPVFIDGKSSEVPSKLNFKNNILQNSAGQYTVRISKEAYVDNINFDYNCFFTTGNFAKIESETIADFDAWKEKFDGMNSINTEVSFVGDADLHILENTALKVGTPLEEVSTDIDGESRNSTATYMGADEYKGIGDMPPAFYESYPQVTDVTENSIQVIVKLDKTGQAKYLCLPADEDVPAVNYIKEHGAAFSYTKDEEKSISIDELNAETAYQLHIITFDAEDNTSTEVTSVEFTTTAAPLLAADFENLTLENESFWNGEGPSSTFESGSAVFNNNYNSEWEFWDGFAYSNITDIETPGLANQYAAYAQHSDVVNNQYAVAYVNEFAGTYPTITFNNTNEAQEMSGVLITNSAYAYHTMKNGDDFCKRFGGITGNDPDYFKLTIKGLNAEDEVTGEIDFYLADYRFEDNSQDYIVEDWTWVDLSSLGAVNKLSFVLTSTDNGEYGMNTPAYFCIDQLNGAPYSLKLDDMPALSMEAGESVDLNATVRGGFAPYSYSWTPAEDLNDANIAKPTASPAYTTTYTVTATDSKGNSTEGKVTVYVNSDAMAATFDNFELESESHWMGNSVAGDEGVTTFFVSGTNEFYNYHYADYTTWSGFAYANYTSNDFAGTMDQFKNAVGGAHSGENYGVCYAFNEDPNNKIKLVHTEGTDIVSGMYVTNSAWAVTSMENGDSFAKKFGGEDGNDPDYFKLIATGVDAAGNDTESTEFYLADYRFEDNSEDYIVKDWSWFDLSVLGEVKAVRFHLESSDVGTYGMNTPAYFCFDDFNGTAPAPFAELTLIAGFEDQTINDEVSEINIALADHITCNEGFEIAYNITVEKPEIADAVIENGVLKLTAKEVLSGTTNVVVTASAGDESLSTSFDLTIEKTVGIADIAKEGFELYPNPARDMVTVNVKADARLIIYNTNGQQVRHIELTKGTNKVTVSDFEKGIYLFKVQNAQSAMVQKVIVNNN